jgi:uncharacterized alkaline shock family protein YloU
VSKEYEPQTHQFREQQMTATQEKAPAPRVSANGAQPQAGRTEVSEPAGTRGRTSIADTVVVKIAGRAAREIPGVHDMGGGLSRTLGAVRDRVPGGRPHIGRGVKVEVGERQAAVDVELVVEYGVPVPDVARDVRENVISAVERITGLEVVEVNIAVTDVHLPGDDGDDAGETRVA